MRQLAATLPTLGNTTIEFHKESAEVLDFLGRRELDRLRQVPHLGVAATAFTGVNHSRLEYLLLQCAVIGLIGKLHRHNDLLAISNSVSIAGYQRSISSGEELLKCWALLSNFGHTQYTYGVERGLLQLVSGNPDLTRWLCHACREADVRRWARAAVDTYRDDHFHFLLSFLRISQGRPRDRRKTLCVHLLRNLLLPETELFPTAFEARYKLLRLRRLFYSVRQLSMLTLDSYYSHHPFRVQLNAAVLSLAQLAEVSSEDNSFEALMAVTAGWLADELYLHPRVVAIQREYELRMDRFFPHRFARTAGNARRVISFTNNLMWNGIGRPREGTLVSLMRLTFQDRPRPLLGGQNLLKVLQQLERDIAMPPRTHASVDRNRYTKAIHVDFLYRRLGTGVGDIGGLSSRLYQWLVRSIEADALGQLRRLFPPNLREDEARLANFRHRMILARLEQESEIIRSVLNSLVRYLLPVDRIGGITEFAPTAGARSPFLVRARGSDGHVYDQITPYIQREIHENPNNQAVDRLHELRALGQAVSRSKAPFLIGCVSKFVVRDQLGRKKDDWDGILLELSETEVALRVIEAKNTGSPRRNENQAFSQLGATRDMLRHPYLQMRRRRLTGVGAVLTCSLPTIGRPSDDDLPKGLDTRPRLRRV